MILRCTRPVLALALFAGVAALTSGAEVVILKDGFVIQGSVRKESEDRFLIKRPGTTVRIVKANGLDMIDEGPKVTIFSTHAKQLGEISPDIKIRPEYRAYTQAVPGAQVEPTAYQHRLDGQNRRVQLEVDSFYHGQGTDRCAQRGRSADHPHRPVLIYMVSATHLWRLAYRTNEWDPKTVRALLVMHQELAEPDGKCDPLKRIAIGKFMLDAGWLRPRRTNSTSSSGIHRRYGEGHQDRARERCSRRSTRRPRNSS